VEVGISLSKEIAFRFFSISIPMKKNNLNL